MKTVNNKTTQDIIRWLTEYKARLEANTIKTREKIRKIDKAIRKIINNEINSNVSPYYTETNWKNGGLSIPPIKQRSCILIE